MPTETGRANVEIREVSSIEEYDACIKLQREVFGLPDLEISPRRHLIVSHRAGGWTLGAFVDGRLIGFVHHLAAVNGDYNFGYLHMRAGGAVSKKQSDVPQIPCALAPRALSARRGIINCAF